MRKFRYIGVFDTEEQFAKAVQHLEHLNMPIDDIYAPVPVHHAIRNVAGRSKLPILAYFFGIGAIIAVFAFLYYAAVIDWPLNIGGKPSNSFPSFIIVTLILTILTVTILSLLAFSISAKMYPGKKASVVDARALDDKFIIVLAPNHVPNAAGILKESGASEVIDEG
jgi:hypothetical protein